MVLIIRALLMKLYRYIPALDRENETQLYKGMIENLQCARLRFTNPATLNDPLEAVAPYTFRENGNVVTPNIKEIKEINNPFGFLDKLHIYARHLNSSQMLCYNYIRPLFSDNKKAKDELVNLISEKITPITNDAECQFEYNPDKNERTEFDFYIMPH